MRPKVLGVLVVDPSFQRQGVGAALLQHVLAQKDMEGVPAWLEATAEGFGLYRKMGFKQCGEFAIELKEFGGEGQFRNVRMIREGGGSGKE